MSKPFYSTKEMTARCESCPRYVAAIGCGQNKRPKDCLKKKYETKNATNKK